MNLDQPLRLTRTEIAFFNRVHVDPQQFRAEINFFKLYRVPFEGLKKMEFDERFKVIKYASSNIRYLEFLKKITNEIHPCFFYAFSYCSDPIANAIILGKTEIIDFFLKDPITFKYPITKIAFLLASDSHEDRVAVFEFLKDRGFPINVTENGVTPLHLAATAGNWKNIEWLLRHGANTALENPIGFTPFEAWQYSWKKHLNGYIASMKTIGPSERYFEEDFTKKNFADRDAFLQQNQADRVVRTEIFKKYMALQDVITQSEQDNKYHESVKLKCKKVGLKGILKKEIELKGSSSFEIPSPKRRKVRFGPAQISNTLSSNGTIFKENIATLIDEFNKWSTEIEKEDVDGMQHFIRYRHFKKALNKIGSQICYTTFNFGWDNFDTFFKKLEESLIHQDKKAVRIAFITMVKEIEKFILSFCSTHYEKYAGNCPRNNIAEEIKPIMDLIEATIGSEAEGKEQHINKVVFETDASSKLDASQLETITKNAIPAIETEALQLDINQLQKQIAQMLENVFVNGLTCEFDINNSLKIVLSCESKITIEERDRYLNSIEEFYSKLLLFPIFLKNFITVIEKEARCDERPILLEAIDYIRALNYTTGLKSTLSSYKELIGFLMKLILMKDYTPSESLKEAMEKKKKAGVPINEEFIPRLVRVERTYEAFTKFLQHAHLDMNSLEKFLENSKVASQISFEKAYRLYDDIKILQVHYPSSDVIKILDREMREALKLVDRYYTRITN